MNLKYLCRNTFEAETTIHSRRDRGSQVKRHSSGYKGQVSKYQVVMRTSSCKIRAVDEVKDQGQ